MFIRQSGTVVGSYTRRGTPMILSGSLESATVEYTQLLEDLQAGITEMTIDEFDFLMSMLVLIIGTVYHYRQCRLNLRLNL